MPFPQASSRVARTADRGGKIADAGGRTAAGGRTHNAGRDGNLSDPPARKITASAGIIADSGSAKWSKVSAK